jgi:hypothetical protein
VTARAEDPIGVEPFLEPRSFKQQAHRCADMARTTAPVRQRSVRTFGARRSDPDRQFCARHTSQTAIEGASRRALSVAVERCANGVYDV